MGRLVKFPRIHRLVPYSDPAGLWLSVYCRIVKDASERLMLQSMPWLTPKHFAHVPGCAKVRSLRWTAPTASGKSVGVTPRSSDSSARNHSGSASVTFPIV